MLVHLTNDDTIMRDGFKQFSDIGSFSRSVEDSESTELVCDFFLSAFEYKDVEKVISLVLRKIRMGGKLVIEDFDFPMLFRVMKDLDELAVLNKVVSSKTKFVKSFLGLNEVQKHIPDNFETKIRQYKDGTFLLELERKS